MIFDDNWQRQSVGFQSFIHIMLLNAIVAQIHCERFNRMFEHTKPKIFEIENVLYLDGRKWAHPRVLQQRKYGGKNEHGWSTLISMYAIMVYRYWGSLPLSLVPSIQWKSICIHILNFCTHLYWIDDIYAAVNWVYVTYCGALIWYRKERMIVFVQTE